MSWQTGLAGTNRLLQKEVAWSRYVACVLTQSINGTQGYPLNVIISAKSDPGLKNKSALTSYITSLGLDEGHCPSGAPLDELKANVGNGDVVAQNGTNIFHTRRCVEPNTANFQVVYWMQKDEHDNIGAIFIAATITVSNKLGGDSPIANAYDLGRDEFVARATSNGAGAPVVYPINNSSYIGKVVYNDTQLLANVSDKDLSGGVGTDGRVPILEVTKVNPNSQAGLSSYRPSIMIMVAVAMVASFPTTYFI